MRKFLDSSWRVKLSALIMGSGQLMYGCVAKGIIYILIEIGFIAYMVIRGFSDIVGFFTLGTTKADAWLGTVGDNSVVMLLMGILAWIVVAAFIYLYVLNIKSACDIEERVSTGRAPKSFIDELKELLDRKFYITVLVLPVVGVCIFNILPIIFMILISLLEI